MSATQTGEFRGTKIDTKNDTVSDTNDTVSGVMSAEASGQVSDEAAALYERFFVPALFAQWTAPMLETVKLAREPKSGARVLDVACGTGVLARAAYEHLRGDGQVIGLDPNEGMLAVAAREAPQIEWRRGVAESLPWDDASFDVVVCQFGLMFFEDRVNALREAMRVLRPHGRLAVAVWDSLERTPGFARLAQLLDRIVGREAGDALRVPFSLGEPQALAALFRQARIVDTRIVTHAGTARFPSLPSWVHTNVRGWAFSALVSDAQLEQLVEESKTTMADLASKNGEVAFAAPAHIVSTSKR